MITQKLNPMHPVAQPSRHLSRAYWTRLEFELLAAMSSAAVAHQVAQQKGRAL